LPDHPISPAVPDGDREVLVVCSHGARALYADSINGGMNTYNRDGLPLERRT